MKNKAMKTVRNDMRKIFIAIALILVFVLSGCSSLMMKDPDYEGSTPVSSDPEQQEGLNYNTVVVPPATNGRILFYSTPLPEDQLPGEADIAGYYQMGSAELSNLLDMLKEQKWNNDSLCDRITFNFDGHIYYDENWIYFDNEQSVIFCNGYFCATSDSVTNYIKSFTDKMFKYEPLDV